MKKIEIKKEEIYLNGKLIFQQKNSSFVSFIKAAYRNLEIKYPKFHKMDRLCKLAFVAANYLLGENELEGFEPSEIGVIMANAHATLATDTKYYTAIEDKNNYFPSPAVFVYTLPNIMIGEICIKYKIKGESLFLISSKPNVEQLRIFAQDMLEEAKAKIVLIGWVDYTEADYYAKLELIKNK